jgi:hypothetical protein
MQELRFVAVSEDGRYAVLAIPGRSARFTLPIDERLRAVALGQTSRLAQYEIEVESPLRPKEIQARIRAGETVEEIADAAGISVERVRWFEAPILAERAYAADQAQLASVRRQGDATPGPRLGEIVTERLKMFGADPEDAQWDAKKLGDGSWQVQLTFISGGRLHTAEWTFDPRRRHVLPADDNAARMSLPGTEPPQPAAPAPGEATVTQLAPRLTSASGYGGPIHSAPVHSAPSPAGPSYGSGFGQPSAPAAGFGQPGNGTSGFGPGQPGNSSMGGNGGRARHERPGSARPPILPPQVAESPVAEPQVAEHHIAEPQVAEPQVAEPEAPEPREAEAPAAVVSSAPSAPPVSPAAVAAQVSRAAQVPQPGRTFPPASAPQPERRAQPGRVAQPGRDSQAAQASQPAPDVRTAEEARAARARQETAAVAAPVASPPSPAEEAPSAPSSADATSEQAARQSRKAARGKRSSVPSWDEIMFGSSRQRD